MAEEEIEKLKERFKINFFQIEKTLAGYDERINRIEKEEKEIKRINNELKQNLDGIKQNLKQIDEQIRSRTERLEKVVIENKNIKDEIKQNFIDNIKKIEDSYRENLKIIEEKQIELEKKLERIMCGNDEKFKNIEKQLAELGKVQIKLNEADGQLKSNRNLIDKIEKKIEKYNEKLNNLLKNKSEEFEEIKNNIRERINRVEHLGSRLEEIEKLVEEFDKKYKEWQVFREDLDNDKNLYLELRKVVLTSIEKLKNFEKVFRENLEEFGEISKRVEENERLYEKLSDETKRELSILSAEGKRIEQNIEEFKNKLREKLIKRFEDLDYKLENEVKTTLSKHGELLNNFGERFLSIEQQIKNVKKNIVEKIIDEEMNKLLLILNNKLKDFVTMQDFEVIKSELRNKVEQIRKPEIKPLEERISAIEDSIKELEKLLRSISQRTPVIVE